MTLEDLQAEHAERLAGIGVGDVIHDGITIARVTGEGKQGRIPVWLVECIQPFKGHESVIAKDLVRDVMPRFAP